ncbi:hypothetical protein FN846DRAFT_957973 [Sphaerosporella brunnea]|uniref:RING-type domain-containing protein n=1 Tax=Sphaerosporella brunnea TaxID=1250544 RepID=A0A5J5EQT0_9PEZI|nr:hypothetical protein FN846DRAFT_957973 [Sphaerosporella brunnea]
MSGAREFAKALKASGKRPEVIDLCTPRKLSYPKPGDIIIDLTSEECPICMREEADMREATTPCGHTFCAECAKDALSRTALCPLCRGPVTVEELVYKGGPQPVPEQKKKKKKKYVKKEKK